MYEDIPFGNGIDAVWSRSPDITPNLGRNTKHQNTKELAKLVSGEVDQSEQKFLSAEEMAAGYTATCVAYARSDCTLQTHQEPMLYQSSLYAPKIKPL